MSLIKALPRRDHVSLVFAIPGPAKGLPYTLVRNICLLGELPPNIEYLFE